MDRKSAVTLLEKYLPSKNLLKHSFAVEAAMEAMAVQCKEDTERWALAGLLHDLDYEITKDNFSRHGKETGQILREQGFQDEEILDAIVMHSGNIPRTSLMGAVLYAVDPATGFLTACALMHPEKKLSAVDQTFIIKRFKEKRFAKGADRYQINSIETVIATSVDDFLMHVRDAMISISDILGL